MSTGGVQVVTGAFGYTGKYITRRLLAAGCSVRTLTGHPNRPNPFGERVSVARLAFDTPQELAAGLTGASTLFNTYWVRFERRGVTFDQAVVNTRMLIAAAREAGIRRIVHVSITNADEQSDLPYFRGKGLCEWAVRESGLGYAIVRPTVIFGDEDILINNIAWFFRHMPVFTIPGDGEYRLQPVFVEDLADLCVRAAESSQNQVVDAVGPETFTFEQCVRLIAGAVGSRTRVIHLSPKWTYRLTRAAGHTVHDVILTWDEIRGLMRGLLVSAEPPTGHTRFTPWLCDHADSIGRQYASELQRHYR